MFKHSWILAILLVFVAAFACGCVSEEGAEEGAATEESHQESAVSAEEEEAPAPMKEVENIEAGVEEMADQADSQARGNIRGSG